MIDSVNQVGAEESSDADIRDALSGIRSRDKVLPEVEQRVYEATLREFQQLPNPATAKLSGATWAIAATLGLMALGALGVMFNRTEPAAPKQIVGNIVYATGGYRLSGTVTGNGTKPVTSKDGAAVGEASPLAVSDRTEVQALWAGTTITTPEKTLLLVEMPDATNLRMDRNTVATLRGDGTIHLSSGRVYVDAHHSDGSVVVTTPSATVTKVGTQFEVSSSPTGMSVAVREGRVRVATSRSTVAAAAANGVGEELHFDVDNQLTQRTAIESYDKARWNWLAESRPDFDPSTGTLLDYLVWVAHETGRELVFSEQGLRRAAAVDAVNHATSVDDLNDAIRSSAELRLIQAEPWRLVIGRREH